jgi:ABC-type transport system substrate-binding protein
MIPTDQYLPPTMPGFERRAIYPLAGDPAAARRLVGARRRTAVLYSCDLALCRRQAQQIGHDLGRIGIDVDVKEFPLGELIERATKPHAPFDILAGWWFVDYADPSDVLNVLLEPKYGLSHFDSAHANARLERVAQLSGPARYRAYGKLAIELARDDAPWVAYAVGTARDFFSARIGCQTFNPVYGMDLARLCVRRPVR